MSFTDHQHSAFYSEDGSIIIPDESTTPGEVIISQDLRTPDEFSEDSILVAYTDEVYDDDTVPTHVPVRNVLHEARSHLTDAALGLLEETGRQYRYSAKEAQSALQSSAGLGKGIVHSIKGFLLQPVWIVKKNKKPKKYSRLSLFFFDTFRFGGTFAAIFIALFFSLNYQSFWQIVSPHFNPLSKTETLTALATNVDNALTEKLLRSPTLAVAGAQEGNLLSYLPNVGPPENRIIVPKLNLNVPLVTPSYDSLLQEDWEGVETDIQDALQHGVVHYPGTARPGQAGNFFITGHSSYYPWAPGKYKTVFARLHELDVGDEYWVYYGGDKHRYRIAGKKEVKPSDVTVLDQPIDKRISTMMTCTPVGTTLRRLIVTSVEIDPITGEPMEVGEHESRPLPKMQLEALPI